jgi:hypothetical protein
MDCVFHDFYLTVQLAEEAALPARYSNPQLIRLDAIPPKPRPIDAADGANHQRSIRQVQ